MLRAVVLALVLAAGALHPVQAATPPGAPDCEVFPNTSVWHSIISKLPVHPRSDAWLKSMNASTERLHPDFGPSFGKPMPYGIPYDIVDSAYPRVSVAFDYHDESDPGPYPIGDDTTIEMGSDRHALVIDRDACILYELFNLRQSGGGWAAGSGAIFDLRSNALRPKTWTSADAAGLPIFAGLVRKDEVAAGRIDHAIRVTAQSTSRSFLWPARHHAGSTDDPNVPPMGARFRLKTSFDISGFRADTKVILRAMKRYGLILADNGSDWFFTGTGEDGWNTDMLDELKTVPASAFVAVDVSRLRMFADSGRAKQPTTTSLTSDRTRAVGQRARLTGRVLPKHAGKSVVIQVRGCRTCAWRYSHKTTLDQTSSYRTTMSSARARSIEARAVYRAQDADHLASRSGFARITWR